MCIRDRDRAKHDPLAYVPAQQIRTEIPREHNPCLLYTSSLLFHKRKNIRNRGTSDVESLLEIALEHVAVAVMGKVNYHPAVPVSYTHLDVYKRQVLFRGEENSKFYY